MGSDLTKAVLIIILSLFLSSALPAAMTMSPLEASASQMSAAQNGYHAYSSAPSTIWNRTYGGPEDDRARALAQTSDGGYAIAGSTTSSGAGGYDFWLVKAGYHDVAVTNVTPSKTVVGQGMTMSINVTVENQGGFTESLNVTAYYSNETISGSIGTQTVNDLSPADSTMLVFIWDTKGVPYGSYAISANAYPVPDEADTEDNTYTDGIITVTVPGDVNGDRVVNLQDAILLSTHYGHSIPWPHPGIDPNIDINNDGFISLQDAVILSTHYGQSY